MLNDAKAIVGRKFEIQRILIRRGRSLEMPQGIDDFTIVLPELTDMAECKLKVYALHRKWLVRCNQIRRRNWHCPESGR
jgi:hypothetical protein